VRRVLAMEEMGGEGFSILNKMTRKKESSRRNGE
jgi:hypothetical protein